MHPFYPRRHVANDDKEASCLRQTKMAGDRILLKFFMKELGDKSLSPNISDFLDQLGKCQYFTTLDVAYGFYQTEKCGKRP